MLDACRVDNKDCPESPTYHYRWEWGEEGVCCDGHKGLLETRRGQLGRAITFSALGRSDQPTRRREYSPPQLREVPADVGALQMELAEHKERSKKSELQIARLEGEREKNITHQREQELRIQDLLKQNGELKAAAANAELQAQAAVELATPSEQRQVIEGGEAPPTPSTHGSKGKRSH